MNIWGRLGISVAIIAGFAIVMAEVLQEKDFYQVHRWGICMVLLAMGGFLSVVGSFVNAKIRQSRQPESGEVPREPFILVNLAYWGLILTIFGIIVMLIVPTKEVEARAVEGRSGKKPRPAATNQPVMVTNAPVVATNPPSPPVVFPNIKLQGLVYRENKPSALISGRTYFLGESVEDAKLVFIGTSNVVLELRGQRRTLELAD